MRVNNRAQPGTFMVSLDFELYWGMRDQVPLEKYKANLAGVHQAIPLMLEIFRQYNIHATWAIVGFILFQDSNELLGHPPSIKPDYENRNINPYMDLPDTEANPSLKSYYFAPSLVKAIAKYPFQEIASHSLSHFYTNEKGSNVESFREDLITFKKFAQKHSIETVSYIFPRQQYSQPYLNVLIEQGIKAFRGNPRSFIHHDPETRDIYYPVKRGVRLLDSLINITGHQASVPDTNSVPGQTLLNIPASRFFHPYCPSNTINMLRLERIMRSMRYAAERGEIFHLWWHPHNFGINISENIQRLKSLLDYYLFLQKTYGMRSMNMQEFTQTCSTTN